MQPPSLQPVSIEDLVAEIIRRIGDTTDRTGLKDTPKRVARSWAELYRGYDPEQSPEITVFPNGSDGVSYNEMITDTGTFYSMCEHHMLPFHGHYSFGYIPAKKGNVLGLSKVARVVAHCSARLQVQERLTTQIVDTLWDALATSGVERPRGMALTLRATHLCKSMRGVKQHGLMTTHELRGIFKSNPATRAEFLHSTGGSND